MDASQIKALKEKVQAMLKELEAELHASAGDEAVVTLDTSIGRLSRMDAMQQQSMELATEERRQQRLLALTAALRRIEAGDYGFCLKCDGDIASGRLAVDPAVTLCIDCA